MAARVRSVIGGCVGAECIVCTRVQAPSFPFVEVEFSRGRCYSMQQANKKYSAVENYHPYAPNTSPPYQRPTHTPTAVLRPHTPNYTRYNPTSTPSLSHSWPCDPYSQYLHLSRRRRRECGRHAGRRRRERGGRPGRHRRWHGIRRRCTGTAGGFTGGSRRRHRQQLQKQTAAAQTLKQT